MLFWSDTVAGKGVIKSSRVIIAENNIQAAEFMKDNEKEICNTPTSVKRPYAVPFASNGGQSVVWEENMSGRFKIGGSLMRGDSFSFVGQAQRRPIIVANEKADELMVIWQEVINAKQTNLFAQKMKVVTHKCTSCSAPRVCIRDERCVLPFKGRIAIYYIM